MWYAIAIFPVIGIIPAGNNASADRYTYLPSIGITIMLAWGIPLLFKSADMRKKILVPAGIAVLAILSFLTWQQCGYWKNSTTLFSHALQVTKDNALAHIILGRALAEEGKYNEAIAYYNKAILMTPVTPDNIMSYNKRGLAYNKLRQLAHVNLGSALAEEGKYNEAIVHYNKAIGMTPLTPDHILAYNKRGMAYNKLGQNQRALEDFNEAIKLDRYDIKAYENRGVTYAKLGLYQRALEDFNETIRLKPNYADTYNNRGVTYAKLGLYQRALEDFNKVIRLKHNNADAYYNRGVAYIDLGQQERAFDDFDEAIRLKPNYADAYNNRGGIYLNQGYGKLGCSDAQKACELGNCEVLETAKRKGYCR
jgi:tetratricopeptide (TPR) repeat protein